jgi:dihydrofolate reductase
MTATLGAIWAQTFDGIIGRDGKMPWHVPEDLQHFKEVTAGKPVIMGRRTWESLPNAYKPLPGRVNIVVSSSATYGIEQWDGATWVPTLDAALGEAYRAQEVTNGGGNDQADAWIIGGGTLYTEALARRKLPYYGRVHVIEQTMLATADLWCDIPGDTKAPELNLDDWVITNEQLPSKSESGWIHAGHSGRHPVIYQFITYTPNTTHNTKEITI